MGVDYLVSILFNLLLHITKGPAYTATRTPLGGNGHEDERSDVPLLVHASRRYDYVSVDEDDDCTLLPHIDIDYGCLRRRPTRRRQDRRLRILTRSTIENVRARAEEIKENTEAKDNVKERGKVNPSMKEAKQKGNTVISATTAGRPDTFRETADFPAYNEYKAFGTTTTRLRGVGQRLRLGLQ